MSMNTSTPDNSSEKPTCPEAINCLRLIDLALSVAGTRDELAHSHEHLFKRRAYLTGIDSPELEFPR
jgi:hypothetical protein